MKEYVVVLEPLNLSLGFQVGGHSQALNHCNDVPQQNLCKAIKHRVMEKSLLKLLFLYPEWEILSCKPTLHPASWVKRHCLIRIFLHLAEKELLSLFNPSTMSAYWCLFYLYLWDRKHFQNVFCNVNSFVNVFHS